MLRSKVIFGLVGSLDPLHAGTRYKSMIDSDQMKHCFQRWCGLGHCLEVKRHSQHTRHAGQVLDLCHEACLDLLPLPISALSLARRSLLLSAASLLPRDVCLENAKERGALYSSRVAESISCCPAQVTTRDTSVLISPADLYEMDSSEVVCRPAVYDTVHILHLVIYRAQHS